MKTKSLSVPYKDGNVIRVMSQSNAVRVMNAMASNDEKLPDMPVIGQGEVANSLDEAMAAHGPQFANVCKAYRSQQKKASKAG